MTFLRFCFALFISFAFLSCKNDGNLYIPFKGVVKTYPVSAAANPSLFYGNITFTELEDSSTLVRVVFDSLQNSKHLSYPVALVEDNFIDGGKVLAYFNPIAENRKTSKTTVRELSNQLTPFSQIVDLDAHVKVFSSDTTKVIYQADVGQNELTDTSKLYTIKGRNGFLLSGNAKFTKRKNGETQVFLRLSNVVLGQKYKVSLVKGSEESPVKDTIAVLGQIEGQNSNFYFINIPNKINGTILNYDSLEKIDAHLTFTLNDKLVASANVGLNSK